MIKALMPWTAAFALITLGACDDGQQNVPQEPAERAQLGLMTSLPIYWQETESFGDLISSGSEPHWVRSTIGESYELVPLDALTPEAMADLETLLLAQPRGLSPEENLALDEWVRAGGRVVIFADPLITQHSHFALGDARGPQAVALLSPILARWGLELTFDAAQEPAARLEPAFDTIVPINFAGAFRAIEGGFEAQCDISDNGLAARCAIGEGRALLIADADILDHEAHDEIAGKEALQSLLQNGLSR